MKIEIPVPFVGTEFSRIRRGQVFWDRGFGWCLRVGCGTMNAVTLESGIGHKFLGDRAPCIPVECTLRRGQSERDNEIKHLPERDDEINRLRGVLEKIRDSNPGRPRTWARQALEGRSALELT